MDFQRWFWTGIGLDKNQEAIKINAGMICLTDLINDSSIIQTEKTYLAAGSREEMGIQDTIMIARI